MSTEVVIEVLNNGHPPCKGSEFNYQSHFCYEVLFPVDFKYERGNTNADEDSARNALSSQKGNFLTEFVSFATEWAWLKGLFFSSARVRSYPLFDWVEIVDKPRSHFEVTNQPT